MLASRCTLTAGLVCVAILSATLIPASHSHSPANIVAAVIGEPEAVGGGQQEVRPQQPVKVSSIAIQAGKTGETIVDVATSSPIPYRVLQMENPRRLVVDLDGAQRATPQDSYPAESPLLERVRVGQFRAENPPIVRVVLDLRGNPASDVRSTPSGIRIELRPRELALGPAAPAVPPAPQQATPQPSQAPPTQAVPAPSGPGSSNVFYQPSPFGTSPQNQKLLDSLGLKIVLTFNYRKGAEDEAAWRTRGIPGVEATRLFIRRVGPSSYRTVELAITPLPQGGYELAVYGQQVDQTAAGPNPDLPGIQQLVSTEVTRMQQAPAVVVDPGQLSYETYYLSYVVADRALALLKTLGYTTVEYNAQAGESPYQSIYNPLKLGTGRPPIIVKLIDSTKTSLMEPSTPAGTGMVAQMPVATPQQAAVGTPTTVSGVPAIGGTFLHQMTSGEPQERLLIFYDKNDLDSLERLLNLLQNSVDVPSRQIMIEALVVELNSTRARELGVTFEAQQSKASIYSVDRDATTGEVLPFVFSFDKSAVKIATFKASLAALLKTGEAELLSNPSVLVLDGRQARIQIGQQVPITKQLTTAAGTISSVDYFPVGIVLNLRPRVNEDGSEITMQTETIVSAINLTASKQQVVGTNTLVAPYVDNRQVQSIVRVADNTPFIIGGLISTNDQREVSGIPLLSQIPVLGALFRNSTVSRVKQEVIIVVTPHVIPLEDKYFSYVIPKDSDQFDRFNYRLFRNAYRIRGNDLFDLEFVYDSNVYKQLVSRLTAAGTGNPQLRNTEPFASVLKGGVPSEDILVRRMLWEIIDKTHFARYIDLDRIIFFEDNPSAAGGSGFQLAFLNQKLKATKEKGLALTFEAQPQGTEERPFVPPKAVISYPDVTVQNYPELLINGNSRYPDGTPRKWMVLLSKDYNFRSGLRVSPLELLQGVLVLKRLLDLNRSMPLTLKEFHIGRQIVFPSQEELQQGYHLIDRQVAKLFYEVYDYYPVFEREFNRETRRINALLDRAGPQQ